MSNTKKDKWEQLAEDVNDGFIEIDSIGRFSLNVKKFSENNSESREKLKKKFGLSNADTLKDVAN